MRILALESSCDDTAAAIVRDGRWVEGNAVATQLALHQPFGGIVPEVASRAHVGAIAPVVREAMAQAEVGWDQIDLIAATMGPGLAGSLLIGLNTAKGIAYGRDLPFLGVNHLVGHMYANWLTTGEEPDDPEFPLLCLIVSGGHSDLVLMRSHTDVQRIGRTLDDAAGEAFDKVARILGLGFPGGPIIQKMATEGDPGRYPLPRAWLAGTHNFSFSGLKTATLHLVQRFGDGEVPVADVAAAFQEAVADVLSAKTAEAAREFGARQILIAGGVSANSRLRELMQERAPAPLRMPALKYCTDNAAMVGSAGYFRWMSGERTDLDVDVQPNLPVA